MPKLWLTAKRSSRTAKLDFVLSTMEMPVEPPGDSCLLRKEATGVQ